MMSKPDLLICSRAASSTVERETFNLTVQGSIPWRPTSCVAGVTESAPAFYADGRGSTPRRRAMLRWSKRTSHQALNLETAGSNPARSTQYMAPSSNG
jgi:hypothetical protein